MDRIENETMKFSTKYGVNKNSEKIYVSHVDMIMLLERFDGWECRMDVTGMVKSVEIKGVEAAS